MIADIKDPHPMLNYFLEPRDLKKAKVKVLLNPGSLLDAKTPQEFVTISLQMGTYDRIVTETVTRRHTTALITNVINARDTWMASTQAN
jgi:hypothetical protein